MLSLLFIDYPQHKIIIAFHVLTYGKDMHFSNKYYVIIFLLGCSSKSSRTMNVFMFVNTKSFEYKYKIIVNWLIQVHRSSL